MIPCLFLVVLSHFLIYFFSLFLFYFLTLQYCICFAIYQNESATGIHVSLLMFHDLQVSIQIDIFSWRILLSWGPNKQFVEDLDLFFPNVSWLMEIFYVFKFSPLFIFGLGLIKLSPKLAYPLLPLLTTQDSWSSIFKVPLSLPTQAPLQRWRSRHYGYHERSQGSYHPPVPSYRLNWGVSLHLQISTR